MMCVCVCAQVCGCLSMSVSRVGEMREKTILASVSEVECVVADEV